MVDDGTSVKLKRDTYKLSILYQYSQWLSYTIATSKNYFSIFCKHNYTFLNENSIELSMRKLPSLWLKL